MNTLSGPPNLGMPFPEDIPMPEFEYVYPFPIGLIPDSSTQKKLACIYSDPKRHILSDPYQLSCGHIICKPCRDKNIKDRVIICPLAECKSHINIMDIFEDVVHAREVNGVVVNCLEPKCSWKGEFQHYKKVHVYNCSESSQYLKEEIKYLKVRYEHNINIPHKSDTDSQALEKELENKTQENQKLTEKVLSQKHKIELFEGTLKTVQDENASLLAIIDTLVNEQQSARPSGYNSHTHNTETKPGIPKVKVDNTSKVVHPGTVSQASTSGVVGQTICSWKFDHTENLNKSGVLQHSEPFHLNNHTFQLTLVQHDHEYLALYVRVINGDNVDKHIWPCSESMTFIMRDHSKHNCDITRTVHLSRAPNECRRFPGKTPLPLVGFKHFCRLSSLQPPRYEYQSCYLDSGSKTTIDVVSADQIKPGVFTSPYDVIGGVGLISWPIRNCTRKLKSHQYNDGVIGSPIFYTSANGYCFKLILNINGTDRSNKTKAGVCAQLIPGKYDEKLTWPVSGEIKVSLLDRRLSIEDHRKEDVSTVISVNSKNRVVKIKSHHDEYQAQTESKDFFPLMSLQSDQQDPCEPIYKFNDEIVIKAEFIPKEVVG
ncbi:hypothetical protein [Endozoicomonas sp. YOMI1]|uniref:hypothetical protein n=1 Tax=Endozoicomonas sp. YOMI1 TaxID=2828739 RepID=UPI002147A0C8|nr:hypothetical protein [Endozoicomonas sp. YOMI1]